MHDQTSSPGLAILRRLVQEDSSDAASPWLYVHLLLFALTILCPIILTLSMRFPELASWFGIVFKRAGVFERTPKFGITRKDDGWHSHRYQLAVDPIVLPEILFALLNTWTTWVALQTNNWAIAIYSGIFCAGLLFTSGITILQNGAIDWHQRIPSEDQLLVQAARPIDRSASFAHRNPVGG